MGEVMVRWVGVIEGGGAWFGCGLVGGDFCFFFLLIRSLG